MPAPCCQQCVRQLPIRQRCRTALSHQIEGQNVRAQAQALDHVTGQPGAEVTRAGTDNKSVNFRCGERRFLQRRFAGGGGQDGGIGQKPGVQRIGVNRKDFTQGLYRQRSVRDPIVFGQDCFGNDVCTTIQFEEPRGSLEGFPAFGFAVALRWISSSETSNEHPDSNRVHADMPATTLPLEPRPRALDARKLDLHEPRALGRVAVAGRISTRRATCSSGQTRNAYCFFYSVPPTLHKQRTGDGRCHNSTET